MKQITAREFAILCRSDPNLYEQAVAIPGSVAPEKIIALAERNGYRIVPEKSSPPEDRMELLDVETLSQVTGGVDQLTQQEKLEVLHTWIYYAMGFGSEINRQQPNDEKIF